MDNLHGCVNGFVTFSTCSVFAHLTICHRQHASCGRRLGRATWPIPLGITPSASLPHEETPSNPGLAKSSSILAVIWQMNSHKNPTDFSRQPLLTHSQRATLLLAFVTLGGAVSATAIPEVTPATDPLAILHVEDLHLPLPEIMNGAETPFVLETTMRRGDTLSALLARLGVKDVEARGFIASRSAALHYLRPETKVVARTSRQGRLYLLNAADPRDEKALNVARDKQGLTIQEEALSLETRIAIGAGNVHSTLSAAMETAGLPEDVAGALPAVFGSRGDFLRKLKRGDHFSVVYEVLSHQGAPYRNGRILAAEFSSAGKTNAAYWFAESNGKSGYYSADGRSLRENFLRSPVVYFRISSGFVEREHPVLKKWIQHKGIDFSAPVGTPVQATANGVVDFVGDMRGFGNFIVLRHGKTVTTAYGHLDGFAEGLKKGDAIHQGDVIGFVGQTSWATGPHLHYEFRINGAHKDPLTTDVTTALAPGSPQLAEFRARVASLRTPLASGSRADLAFLD